MPLQAKGSLIKLSLLAALTLVGSAHAAHPFESSSPEIEKYQQSAKAHATEMELNRHRHDHGRQESSSNLCLDERNLRSVQGHIHASIKFLNNSNQEVHAHWLDYSGRRVFYKSIPPHGQYTQPTFQTHPWVVTDVRDNCLNIFMSQKSSAIAEIR